MGRFAYDESRTGFDVDDRTLAHLQQVIGSKLRRGECFFFTWKNDSTLGGGRQTVWMHPGASLQFHYHGSRDPQLNRDWLGALAYVANSPAGLHLVREPAPGGLHPHTGGIPTTA